MEWYTLFRQHILDRGIQYYEDVMDMYCSCPHAAGGNNCKHMAAVLFRFEEMLAKQDAESEYDIDSDVAISEDEFMHNSPSLDYLSRFNKQKAEVIELVSSMNEYFVKRHQIG